MDNPQQNNNPSPSSPVPGIALILAATFCFSAKAVLVKLTYGVAENLEPITIMAGRMLFGLPCFLLAALWAARKSRGSRLPLSLKEWAAVVGLGFSGYYLATLLDTTGLAYISAGLERLILFSYPTLVVLFGALIYRRKVTGTLRFVLLLTYAGIALACRNQFAGESANAMLGAGLVFGAAVSFAMFTLGSAVMIRRIGATRFTAYAMSASGLFTATHYLTSDAPPLSSLPEQVVVLCAAMALFATVIPAFMMSAGLRRIGPEHTAVIGSVGPVITIGLGAAVLGEAVTSVQLAGTGLVLSGVLLMGRVKQPT